MDGAGKLLWSFEFPFHEGLVDYDLSGDVRQFVPLSSLELLLHRFEAELHPVNTHRDAIDKREGLGVLRQHWRIHA